MNSDTEVKTAEADRSMNAALKAKVKAMRELERQALPTEYQRAQHCRDVVEGDGKYGDHAVETFADAIKWSPTQVYGYAKIAQLWSKGQVREMQNTKHCTWSHLLVLARDSVADQRESLIEKVSADELSVQALRNEIKATAPPDIRPPSTDFLLDTSPFEALVESLQDYGAKLLAFENGGNADVQRLRQAVHAAKAEDLTLKALQQLRQLRKRLKAASEHDIKLLDDCIAKAEKAIKTKTAVGKAQATVPVEQADASAAPDDKVTPKPSSAATTKNRERSQNWRKPRQAARSTPAAKTRPSSNKSKR